MTQRYLLRHSPFTSSDKTSSLSRCRYAALSPVRSVSSALMSGLVPVILLWSGASPDSLFSLYPRGAWTPNLFSSSLSLPSSLFFLLLSGKMSQACDIVVFIFNQPPLENKHASPIIFVCYTKYDSHRTALCPQPLRGADRLDYAEISCTREERLSLPLTILSAADVQHC